MLKLVRRHGGHRFYLRGSVRGIAVDESTRTSDRKVAEEIRAKREAELLKASIYGKQVTATFLMASVAYLEAGGERRYLERLIKYFGATLLAKIDQSAIDRAARISRLAKSRCDPRAMSIDSVRLGGDSCQSVPFSVMSRPAPQ